MSGGGDGSCGLGLLVLVRRVALVLDMARVLEMAVDVTDLPG